MKLKIPGPRPAACTLTQKAVLSTLYFPHTCPLGNSSFPISIKLLGGNLLDTHISVLREVSEGFVHHIELSPWARTKKTRTRER